jgi:cytochrome oxidase assembly protein ShyY1
VGFLLSRRWIGFAVFVVVLAGICVRMGVWQFDRLDERRDSNEIIARHLAADPVPIAAVLRPGGTVDESTEWTRVRASGVYDVEHEVTVKFTTRDGAPGVDVVTPLRLPDGTTILVDRGWLQTENTTARPTNVPAPPSGRVSVTGWLRPDSGADDDAVRPVGGQVRAISSAGLAPSTPGRLYGGYLNLRSQQPAAETPLALEPRPELGQGPHFFYGLQWWFFGLLAVIGYVWFARDELKERRAKGA